jgi:DNA-binding NarL/FixJ family response regulator
VAAGEAIFGPEVARRLMQHFSTGSASPSSPFPELSDREHEILELVARGMANQAIGDRLGIAPKTVRNHVSNIFGKLQVRDRAEAVVRAREAGLGERSPRG